MATNTTNFNLKKPAYTDTADIADINGNMDKVDVSLNGLADAIAIVANNNTHAAITAGQYVYVHGHGSLAEGLYTAKSNIAANATLSTSNLQADSSGGLNAINSKMIGFDANATAITSVSDIVSIMNAKNDGDIHIAGVTAGVLSSLLNVTTIIGGPCILLKASAANAYFYAYNKEIAGIGNISLLNGTITSTWFATENNIQTKNVTINKSSADLSIADLYAIRSGNVINIFSISGFKTEFTNVGTRYKLGRIADAPNSNKYYIIPLRDGNNANPKGYGELLVDSLGDIYITPMVAGYNLAFSVNYLVN